MYFKVQFEPGFFTCFLLPTIFLKRLEIELEKMKMFFQFTKSRAISILQTMRIISRTAHHAEGWNHRVLLAGYRSRLFVSAA